MRTVVIVVCLGLLASAAYAQPDSLWSRIYGGAGNDRFYTIQQTADGGFIAGGVTTSSGAGLHDAWIMKTDASGNELWSQTFGTPWEEHCSNIYQTEEGYVLGVYAIDFWLIFTDQSGGFLRDRIYGGEERERCRVMIPTGDGGYLMAGDSDAIIEGDFDFYVIKTDGDGDSLWSNTFGHPWNDFCYAAVQTADGGYMLGGFTRFSVPGPSYFWLIRLNSEGDSLWSRTFGEGVDAVCYDLQQTADGGFIAAGTTGDWAERDFYVVKADSEGDELWNRTFGDAGADVCQSVLVTPDNGYLLAGYRPRPSGSGFGDVWLVRLDSGGDSLWSRAYGDSIGEYCNAILPTADHGYIVAGEIYPIEDAEGFLMKLGPDSLDPAPPGPFERLQPADSSLLIWTPEDMTIEFIWTQSVDPNGDDVSYIFHVESPTHFGIDPADAVIMDTSVIVEISLPVDELDDLHDFYWTVHAAANGDTVEASNGQGFFTMDLPGDANEPSLTPDRLALSVYPNPFNPSMTIRYDLDRRARITVAVHDLLGRQVAELVNRTMPAGNHRVDWSCPECATGVYLVVLESPDSRSVRKAVLMR